MTGAIAVLVCTGRDYDVAGRALSDICGSTIRAGSMSEVVDGARALGWKVSPRRVDGRRDAMCPNCGRPDPAITRALDSSPKGGTA